MAAVVAAAVVLARVETVLGTDVIVVWWCKTPTHSRSARAARLLSPPRWILMLLFWSPAADQNLNFELKDYNLAFISTPNLLIAFYLY